MLAHGGENAIGCRRLCGYRPGGSGNRCAALGTALYQRGAAPLQLAQAEDHGLIAS
jgi:hypothetical protein